MKKQIEVGNKLVDIDVNADVPRLYRELFSRDIFVDVFSLKKELRTEIVENILYAMAFEYDENIGDKRTFLRQFDGIYDVLNASPDILGAWEDGEETTSKSKTK